MVEGASPNSMQIRAIHLYVAAMGVGAIAVWGRADWASVSLLNSGEMLGLGALVVMALFSEGLAVRLDVGRSSSNTSVTFIPLLAAVQLFGPASALVLIAFSAVFGEFVIHRKEFIRAIFNVSQLIVGTAVAGAVFTLFGGQAIGSIPDADTLVLGQLGPFVSFGLVFLAANHAAVSLAIALSQGRRFSEVWSRVLEGSGASVQDLLISPIALAVAFLYLQAGAAGILVVLLPLLFIRHSYRNTSLLRAANVDLLNALVKAIETRDPYTSGHSRRVAFLARRIAEEMALPLGAVERIEQAALLHDIGKIEAAYSGILAKPAALTPEERAVIQSHATKGEEFLRRLSSVPEEVILTVRHHHERQDGAGYPDGLRGNEIPLGARIIGVCDAVDAMLSDRPYRKALTVSEVKDQLRQYAGFQFAPHVVDVLLSADLVSEYYLMWGGSAAVPGAPADHWEVPLPSPRRRRSFLRSKNSVAEVG